MNCFVIMPFGPDFDDVYAAIKASVDGVRSDPALRCFRLDEHRPAGRITSRLLHELRGASICIADLSGCRANVMWELGFVMALETPTILITQSSAQELPFDVHDMHCIPYERTRLTATLTGPLSRSIVDTLSHPVVRASAVAGSGAPTPDAVAPLALQIEELRAVIKDLVATMRPASSDAAAPMEELRSLEGHWVNVENGSHAYARIIDGQLVAPYCYGNNTLLTGLYHDWRRVGDHWYGQFHWVSGSHAGFTFLKRRADGALVGAWWFEDEAPDRGDAPPDAGGSASTWLKQPDDDPPRWASDCLADIRSRGVRAVIGR